MYNQNRHIYIYTHVYKVYNITIVKYIIHNYLTFKKTIFGFLKTSVY